MTLPEQMIRAELFNSRITRTNAIYARYYGPLCLLVVALTFFPYYESEPDSSIIYGNLWQEVVRLGPGYDLMALLVLLLTALLLVFAAMGKLSTSGLIAILVGSTVIGSTLLQSPGYVDPPTYTAFGVVDIVVSFLTAGLVLGHAVHLFVLELAFQRGGV
jgi:hypothetical protein